MAKKTRLDQLVLDRGLAESRSKAQALIISGSIRVNGEKRTKPGESAPTDAAIELIAGLPYVSRGGLKLAHALDVFGLDPRGLLALDAGASTGGFTDVLLQRGAAHVFAVDVGYGIMDYRLRTDARVTPIERTNIRYLERLPPLGDAESPLAGCAVIDVSFISLSIVLPAVKRLVADGGWIVPLIKPQFEAGAEQVGKGGVVRERSVHASVLRSVLALAASHHIAARGLTRSPITGPAGNIEFLAWLGGDAPPIDGEAAIDAALRDAP